MVELGPWGGDGDSALSIYKSSRQEAVPICEVEHSHNLENVQQMQIWIEDSFLYKCSSHSFAYIYHLIASKD